MSNKSFGRYIVTRLVGRGGMATVYQAHDPLLDRKVAIKVILTHLADQVGFQERFLREAKMIASLRHPHLVQLHDFGVLHGQPYMVMEFLDGGSLQAKLAALRQSGNPMPLSQIPSLLQNLAEALDYAHARGAIHRDIKPGNILFTADGEPVLTDFGLVKLLDQPSQLSMAGAVLGTPAYMSPEQAAGESVDGRSDIYALSIVVYELITGRVPFRSDSLSALILQQVTQEPPPLRSFNPNTPPAVEKVVLQALAKAPADRFASAGSFAQAFRLALSGKGRIDLAPDDRTIVGHSQVTPAPTFAMRGAQPSSSSGGQPGSWSEAESASQLLVAREPELAHLQSFLNRAVSGHGSICLVRGETGAGKTALIKEFMRQQGEKNPELVVAMGNCNAQSGLGDPYLPFRELMVYLADLTASGLGLGNPVGRALATHGPDLIDIFIPQEMLAAQLADGSADRSGWMERLEKLLRFKTQSVGQGASVEQSHLFEQVTNVLKALAAQQPLLLVIDDLQWADALSIELLFHLGRRIGESRILLIGAYRPEDVAMGRAGGRHPLEMVLNELQRALGDVEINLRQAQEVRGRHFVDALLDAEPNRLGEPFRTALWQHTGGHPLFTVELLRNMQERGDLTVDQSGQWTEGTTLNWDELSPRVEGVIAERIGRLAAELREILTIASVEGEDFTAEVVARVRDVDARGLIRRLSQELDRQHRLVGATGLQRMDGQRLSRYRFRHNLFQRYLYNQLDGAERAYFHEDVGTVLEELYGAHAEQVCVQLAWHFEEAGLPQRARPYLRMAGERALRQHGYAEAVSHLNRALELTGETEVDDRYALLLAREQAYDVQADRPAQGRDLDELEQLAAASHQPQKQAEVALRQANYAEELGQYAAAALKAQRAIDLAEVASKAEFAAMGYLSWGRALLRLSDFAASRSKLEQALSLARRDGLVQVEADTHRALGIVAYSLGDYDGSVAAAQQALALHQALGDRRGECAALNNLANGLADQGKATEAWENYERANHIYQEIGDREGEGMVLGNLALISDERGDRATAHAYSEHALQIFREIGARHFEANGLTGLGSLCLDEHNYAQAGTYGESAESIYREIGDKRGWAIAVRNLGELSRCQGNFPRARLHFEQALATFLEIGDRTGICSVLSRLGSIRHDLGDTDGAQLAIQEGLDIAREIGDPWQESTALARLGHVLLALGRLSEARECYTGSVALWLQQGRPDLALEPQAGLARVSLQEKEINQAQVAVQEILVFLQTHGLVYADDMPVHLTCYQVLAAAQDPRADSILAATYALLQQRAATLDTEEARQIYLTQAPAHRQIVELWQATPKQQQPVAPDDLTLVE